MLYLASPYTPTGDDPPAIIKERHEAACFHAARLMKQGAIVYSPIAHSHHLADWMPESMRLDHEFWMRQCLGILRHADKLVVLKLKGWDRSAGVTREIQFAQKYGIPVECI